MPHARAHARSFISPLSRGIFAIGYLFTSISLPFFQRQKPPRRRDTTTACIDITFRSAER